jgi:hypothetical protein
MLCCVINTIVAFLTSLCFSGGVDTYQSIIEPDLFSKAPTMFIGELLMIKSQAGQMRCVCVMEQSLAMNLLWQIVAITNMLIMSYRITKNPSMVSNITESDTVFNTRLVFVHERVRARLELGKEYIFKFLI